MSSAAAITPKPPPTTATTLLSEAHDAVLKAAHKVSEAVSAIGSISLLDTPTAELARTWCDYAERMLANAQRDYGEAMRYLNSATKYQSGFYVSGHMASIAHQHAATAHMYANDSLSYSSAAIKR